MRALVVGAAGILAVSAAAGALVAHRLTKPSERRFPLVAHAISAGDATHLVLPASPSTTRAGAYSVMLVDGTLLAVDGVARERDGSVHRVVEERARELLARPRHVAWSGIRFGTPAAAGLDHVDVEIAGQPAWLIPGTGDVWAILIHGLGSPRAGMLRAAQVTCALGMPTLIPTYRSALDAADPHTRSTLGSAEADDVAKAMEHAIAHGARRVVLIGASMGALVALRVAHDPRWQHLIDGVILDSAVLDWRATIAANCDRAHVPRIAGRLAEPWLRFTHLRALLRIPGPVDFAPFDPQLLAVRTLALHGAADDSAPLRVVERFAQARPGLVELHTFDAGHTMTWNADPQRWSTIVRDWLSR